MDGRPWPPDPTPGRVSITRCGDSVLIEVGPGAVLVTVAEVERLHTDLERAAAPIRASTDDKLRALADRRVTAQALLDRALAELDKPRLPRQRRADALTLCCRLIIEIDGMSAEIDVLLDRRQQERDAERPGRIA